MTGVIEKTYAQVVFEIALEQKNTKETLEEMETLDKILDGVPEFVKIMHTPTVSLENKLAMVKEAFSQASEYMLNFLCVLVSKGRLKYFHKITAAFTEMYNEYYNLAAISVVTKFPLDDASREKLIDKLQKATGKNVTLTETVDESILGGIIISYGNTKMDGSVKSRLSVIQNQIKDILI